MLSQLLDPRTGMPRTRMFWMMLGGLVIAQLVALWMLCSHQMRLAEARRTESHVHQMALADCLQYIPGATIAACTSQLPHPDKPAGAQQASVLRAAPVRAPATAATPVSFTFR